MHQPNDPADLLTQRVAELERELAEAREDSARLDWLESRRCMLNRYYGTHYGWQFVSSPNINRLYVKDVNTIDLNDAEATAGDIRAAIDAARAAEGGNG